MVPCRLWRLRRHQNFIFSIHFLLGTVAVVQRLKFRLHYKLLETEGLPVPHGWTESWFSHIFPGSLFIPFCIIPSRFSPRCPLRCDSEALRSYLLLPHCPLITSLPSSQSFLIRLSKSLKLISLSHNSRYTRLPLSPSPNLIFTGFVLKVVSFLHFSGS